MEYSEKTSLIKIRLRVLLIVVLVALAALYTKVSHAHAKGENYVWLNVEEDYIDGRFELNRQDLIDKLGLDIDAEGDTRIEGLQASQSVVHGYLLEHISISDANGEMKIEFSDAMLVDTGYSFVAYPFRISTLPVDNAITIQNQIFLTPDMMAGDRLHRSVLVVEYDKTTDKEFGEENVAVVFSPRKTEWTVDMSNPPSVLVWTDFLWQGFLHIIIGLDHIVFILLILLTVVLRREGWRLLAFLL